MGRFKSQLLTWLKISNNFVTTVVRFKLEGEAAWLYVSSVKARCSTEGCEVSLP
jgi:hypothetical protein